MTRASINRDSPHFFTRTALDPRADEQKIGTVPIYWERRE